MTSINESNVESLAVPASGESDSVREEFADYDAQWDAAWNAGWKEVVEAADQLQDKLATHLDRFGYETHEAEYDRWVGDELAGKTRRLVMHLHAYTGDFELYKKYVDEGYIPYGFGGDDWRNYGFVRWLFRDDARMGAILAPFNPKSFALCEAIHNAIAEQGFDRTLTGVEELIESTLEKEQLRVLELERELASRPLSEGDYFPF